MRSELMYAVSTFSAGTGCCSNAARTQAASISSEKVNPSVLRTRVIFADSSIVNLTSIRCVFPRLKGRETVSRCRA